ncbi:hypothetical protein NHH03_27180 [Stieleria sp. TO1_6]|uniref:hypothetical protein n=1 Tax=Stieleria tagensis TaxID=2956795 RepID=UPI00209A9ADF|nr:hypothetical protein [Stieleria tagensis]MCO8125452.1 hypothetical protein [Stieleria tagensis]
MAKRSRKVVATVAAAVTVVSAAAAYRAHAVEPLQRTGRIFGFGWGDGYHTCRDSGCRPGADLPPKSHPHRSCQLGCANGCGELYPASMGCGIGQCNHHCQSDCDGLGSQLAGTDWIDDVVDERPRSELALPLPSQPATEMPLIDEQPEINSNPLPMPSMPPAPMPEERSQQLPDPMPDSPQSQPPKPTVTRLPPVQPQPQRMGEFKSIFEVPPAEFAIETQTEPTDVQPSDLVGSQDDTDAYDDFIGAVDSPAETAPEQDIDVISEGDTQVPTPRRINAAVQEADEDDWLVPPSQRNLIDELPVPATVPDRKTTSMEIQVNPFFAPSVKNVLLRERQFPARIATKPGDDPTFGWQPVRQPR